MADLGTTGFDATEPVDCLELLPEDCWIHVARFVARADLYFFAAACHSFYAAAIHGARRRLRTGWKACAATASRAAWALQDGGPLTWHPAGAVYVAGCEWGADGVLALLADRYMVFNEDTFIRGYSTAARHGRRQLLQTIVDHACESHLAKVPRASDLHGLAEAAAAGHADLCFALVAEAALDGAALASRALDGAALASRDAGKLSEMVAGITAAIENGHTDLGADLAKLAPDLSSYSNASNAYGAVVMAAARVGRDDIAEVLCAKVRRFDRSALETYHAYGVAASGRVPGRVPSWHFGKAWNAALRSAAERGSVAACGWLGLDGRDASGSSWAYQPARLSAAMRAAARNGHTDVCRLLVRASGGPSRWAGVICTVGGALELAAGGGRLGTVAYLVGLLEGADGAVAHGAAIDAALRRAAGDGHLDVCEWLLRETERRPCYAGLLSILTGALRGARREVFDAFRDRVPPDDRGLGLTSALFVAAAAATRGDPCTWVCDDPREAVAAIRASADVILGTAAEVNRPDVVEYIRRSGELRPGEVFATRVVVAAVSHGWRDIDACLTPLLGEEPGQAPRVNWREVLAAVVRHGHEAMCDWYDRVAAPQSAARTAVRWVLIDDCVTPAAHAALMAGRPHGVYWLCAKLGLTGEDLLDRVGSIQPRVDEYIAIVGDMLLGDAWSDGEASGAASGETMPEMDVAPDPAEQSRLAAKIEEEARMGAEALDRLTARLAAQIATIAGWGPAPGEAPTPHGEADEDLSSSSD